MREQISETPIHGLHLRFTDRRCPVAHKQLSFQLNAVSVVCFGICQVRYDFQVFGWGRTLKRF